MKTLRMLYLVTVYILSIPFFALMAIGVTVYNIVWCVRYKYYDFDSIASGVTAFIQGLRLGHTMNMFWVKYGKKCPVIFDYELKDES